jgi:hypothetical protein
MYLTSHGFAAVASGSDLESNVIASQKHRNASSERSPNHRKDLDQPTEVNSKNPSLNSTLNCLKVVDTFRAVLRRSTASAKGVESPPQQTGAPLALSAAGPNLGAE